MVSEVVMLCITKKKTLQWAKGISMIKLSQFRCTIHALKFFCGVRGGLFVLIMSDFKHTKEVA